MQKKLMLCLATLVLAANLLPTNIVFAEENPESLEETQEIEGNNYLDYNSNSSEHVSETQEQDSESSEYDLNSSEHDLEDVKNSENTPVNLKTSQNQDSESSPQDSKSSEQTQKTRGQDSNSSSNYYNPYSEDGKTRTFNSTYEVCSYLNSTYTDESYHQNCEGIRDLPSAEVMVNPYIFFVNDGETLIFRNVRMLFSSGHNYIGINPGGKVIIEGENTQISKEGGCVIIANKNITSNELEIREGTFVSANGTMSPICYDTGGFFGTKQKSDLPSNEEAMSAFLSYIPEDSEFVDISNDQETILTETAITSTWIYKDSPSWFRGFETWILKVRKKTKSDEPTPAEPENEPETPNEQTEPENPLAPEEKTQEQSPFPTASLTISNPNTSTGKKDKPYELILVISVLVFFTTVRYYLFKRKQTEKSSK